MKILLLILGIVSFSSFGQQRSTPANDKQLKRDRQQARAIALIEQIGSEAELWENKRSAVEALANASDLLWDRNPARASKWLRKAWDSVDQVVEGEQNPALKEFVRRSDRAQLRALVLRVAHSHDPKLADQFVQEIAEQQPEPKKDRGAFDDRTARSEQLLWLAQQSLETNPQLAFNLAQRSLSDGLSFTLQNLLTGLRKKDVALSNQLYDLALARFSSGDAEPSEAEVLAGYLFQPGISFSSNAAGIVIMSTNPAFRGEPPAYQSEPERAHKFLLAAYQMFFTRPLSLDSPEDTKRAQRIWVFGSRNLGRYDSVAPEFSVPLKSYLTQLESRLFPEGREDPFGSHRKASGEPARSEKEIYEARIATLEERAEKTANPVERDSAYTDAALAVDVEDYARAKSIAEKISDDTLRAEVVSFIFYRSAMAQVRKKNFDKASELAPQITNAEQRTLTKIAIAQGLVNTENKTADETKLDQQKALDLLTDVERELRKVEPTANIGKILLARVALIGRFDRNQALVAFQQSLQSINKLDQFEWKIDAAPRLGFKGSFRSEGLVDIPRVGFSLRSAIEPLIATEFENLVNLTDTLKARDLRGLAQLEIARAYLASRG
jgi:hypothetical protein